MRKTVDEIREQLAPLPASGEREQSKKHRRWFWRIVRVALLVYIGAIVVLGAMQKYFIFPGASSQGRRDAVVRPSEGAELLKLQTPEGEVAALFGEAMNPDGSVHPDGAHRPTVLYFYGNGMCMADCVGDFMKLRRRGFNVMVPDFIGYGMSGGSPSEAGVYATAEACMSHLMMRKGIDPNRIVPMGWSLGASAAIHLAVGRQVPAIVIVSAFTSIDDMGRRMFPFAPIGMIVRHHLDNDRKIRQVVCPIFIGHGTRDSIIPFEMSETLAANAGGEVTKYDIEGGDHNDVFDVGGTALADAIAAFVEKHAGGDMAEK